jgi:thiol-disulfide isomerase/thioredoxin
VLVAGLGVAALFVFKPGARAHSANAGTPGEEVDVRDLLVPGKLNIVDFFSEYCPPCRMISPRLQKLAERRSDIAVIKLDINRPGVSGIDWSSPLARQYRLESIPHFQLWDGSGKLLAEGDAAGNRVIVMLAQQGLND